MAKYSKYEYRQIKEKRWEVHPIWRGIGCFLLVLVPVMAYAAAVLMVQNGIVQRMFSIPAEVSAPYDLGIIYKYVPMLRKIIPSLPQISLLNLMLAAALTVVGYGLMSVLYSILYRLFGGNIKSPVDAPPIRRSPGKKHL